MGENRGSYLLGTIVLVLVLILMLGAFNWANNLTAYTTVISILTAISMGFFVATAIKS